MISTAEVTTLAGSGNSGSVDGTGTEATLTPENIEINSNNLYITEYIQNKIRKIDLLTLEVTTIAGNGTRSSIDGTGVNASFYMPRGLVYHNNSLYVNDINSIRKIILASGEVTTIAGKNSAGSSDGVGVNATFNSLEGITVSGNYLYTSEYYNHKIRRIFVGAN